MLGVVQRAFQFFFTYTTLRFGGQVDYLRATVQDLTNMLDLNIITSAALVEGYLARINENNYQGLNLRAVIEIAPPASLIRQAHRRDRELAQGIIRGALHGVPILVKDNIATDPRLGMNTTAGSFAFLGSVVPRDATVVEKLREAGAIIIGKSSLTELSNFKGNNSNGWSARGGQTQSAYVKGGFRGGGDPCGSSSGSAVGVSAGFAPVAIGTESDGSIICPSDRAALYAIKPTVGLVSRAGVILTSSTFETVGPMAKSTYDAALLLSIIAGPDPRDEKTLEIPDDAPTDYTEYTRDASFKNMRLGVPRKFFFDLKNVVEQEILETVDAALVEMWRLGAIIQDPANLPSSKYMFKAKPCEEIIFTTEFKVYLQKYLKELTVSPVRTLEDIINFNDEHSDIEFPPGQCCQQKLVKSIQTTGLENETYQEALKTCFHMGATEGIDAVLKKYDLDALVVPSAGNASAAAAMAGYPIVTVPLGVLARTGQPFGLSFIGTKWSEPILIRLMAAFEAVFPPRAVPERLAGNATWPPTP